METTRAGIAIYKINYQSDFILTVVCDVEWGTPFCIKFWTGEPAQAYYVGWDGKEYRNCKVVESDPSKLLVLFDDHHLPVGELKMQIVYHATIEEFPNAIVDEVTNSMKVIAFIDGKNQKVALDFEGEEAAELQFELPAYANEAQRIANEEQRIANEQSRIEAEQQRIDNEQTRQDNEAQRITQETARVNEYAGLKADAVAATDAANDAATLANQKAQLAADKAALADAAATLANQKAQLAADKAALADAAATLANQKAEYADAQGDYAKEQGDYAKEQGDTALADHRRAESDHETAVSDHTIAANDHTQAGNDHTRAESDHSTAADDHTLAASDHSTAAADHTLAASDHSTAAADHTLAASDHSTAADDHTQAGNDHTRAESDHTRAENDHAAVEVYVDSLGAFDISSYHATGGVLAKYADLTAALGTGGANIPEAIRKGGMSVKFVHTSDNKYQQFRYMGTAVTGNPNPFLDTANWYEEYVGASEFIDANLEDAASLKINGKDYNVSDVESRGGLSILENEVGTFVFERTGYASDTWVYVGNSSYKHGIIPIKAGQSIYIKAPTNSFTQYGLLQSLNDDKTGNIVHYCLGTERTQITQNQSITITAPNDCFYLYVLTSYNGGSNKPSSIKIDNVEILSRSNILSRLNTVEQEANDYTDTKNKFSMFAPSNSFNLNSIIKEIYTEDLSTQELANVAKVLIRKKYEYSNLYYVGIELQNSNGARIKAFQCSYTNESEAENAIKSNQVIILGTTNKVYVIMDWSKVEDTLVTYDATLNNILNLDCNPSIKQELNASVEMPANYLEYDASENKFTHYERIGKTNRYFSFEVSLDIDTSEIAYRKLWRLTGGHCYSYTEGTMVVHGETIYGAETENEFAQKFKNTGDYSGGAHGDERIDIDPSSYVEFFADGKKITNAMMANDFIIECDSFSYIQYSSLHQTSQDGVTPITGHPIIGYHLKENIFKNCTSELENTTIFTGVSGVIINQWHSGLFCVGKAASTTAIVPNGLLYDGLDGSRFSEHLYCNDIKASKVVFWNDDNYIKASVDSHFIEGLEDIANNHYPGMENSKSGFQIVDRTTDTKYYRRQTEINEQTTDGQVIRTRQIVRFY